MPLASRTCAGVAAVERVEDSHVGLGELEVEHLKLRAPQL
jgi:hypothetical protein